MISPKIVEQLDGLVSKIKQKHEEVRVAATAEAESRVVAQIAEKDKEIERLRNEVVSKSALESPMSSGESPVDYADRVCVECIDYLNSALGLV